MAEGSFWFDEKLHIPDGHALRLEITEELHSENTPYQQIRVLRTKAFGKMLVLDGVIQLTEFDEFAYHEMIAHVPLFSHPDPKRVLVIGGGDGGVVREVLRHSGVEEIVFCEIDERVTALCRKFFPHIASGLDDPRVKILHLDGNALLMENHDAFDVIITDSSDPIGPATVLFERPFFENLRAGLRPGGIAVTQAESWYYDQELVQKILTDMKAVFPERGYYYTLVPTYPSGLIGLSYLPAQGATLPGEGPVRQPEADWGLKYYTPEIHRASFQLPRFATKLLETPGRDA